MMVVLVAAGLVLAVAGCGEGDRPIAQEYMVDGNRAYSSSRAIGDELTDTLEEALGVLASGDAAKIQELGTQVSGIEEKIEGYKKLLNTAMARYNNIDKLSGVEEFVDYKKMMNEVILLRVENANKGKEILDMLEPVFTGQPVDTGALLTQVAEAGEEIKNVSKRADRLEIAAGAYQTKYNLTGD